MRLVLQRQQESQARAAAAQSKLAALKAEHAKLKDLNKTLLLVL